MSLSIRRIGICASTLLCSVIMVVASGASAAPSSQEVDWAAVERALGRSGQMMPGDVFRIGIPRTDLKVTVEDVPVQAGFALGSYAAFKQYHDGTMVMGDLVLLDEEVNGVMSGLFEHGFQVTALHNHLNNMSPHVMYMHYEGHGDPLELAAGLHEALSASATPLSPVSPPPPAAQLSGPQLDTGMLDGILGYSGRLNGSVDQFSIPRTETIVEMGHELVAAQGVTTAINFQPTGTSTAAVTGDFVMLESEVNPVASTLRANGIEVTAVHQHHLSEEPRLFYLHFWANGDPASLARGLRAALDQTASVPPQVSLMR
jgi:Domain of Unknown Function (DUF1259)